MKTKPLKIKQEIINILKKHDICHAAIFGSFATGEAREDSDLDILIEFGAAKKKTLLDLASLKIELEELSGRTVDIVEYSAIYPPLRDRILREQEVLM